MKLMKLLAICLMGATVLASDSPRGTVPRTAADKYDVHREQDGFSIGANLLSASQARKTFAADLDRCCMVIEVALYPQKDGRIEVSLNDFGLRVAGKDIATTPASAEVVAGKLQKKLESTTDRPDVEITQTSDIGYRSGGIDPVTGQRRPSGVYTGAGAGVGVGIGGSREPQPSSADPDRRTLELKLREQGLPEGNSATPVSGYLYFAKAPKKNTKYQLDYILNGNKITLALP